MFLRTKRQRGNCTILRLGTYHGCHTNVYNLMRLSCIYKATEINYVLTFVPTYYTISALTYIVHIIIIVHAVYDLQENGTIFYDAAKRKGVGHDHSGL